MEQKQLISAAALVLLGAVVGFSLGRYSLYSQRNTIQSTATPTQTEQVKTNSLFRSQTATFQGEVTKVSGNKLSVKNEKGQSGDFPVSNKVVIYKFKEGSSQASASSELNLIETNKKALVVLELMNGKYQVTSISYLPPPPKK